MQKLRTAKHRTGRARRSRRARAHPAAATSDAGPSSPALQVSVLVLNRLYMAVHVVGVRRAVGLLYKELAEVIHQENGSFSNHSFQSWREVSQSRCETKGPYDDWIRSVNFEIQVPRVIRLLEYDRVPKQRLHLNRRNVLARDGHACQYCGRHFPNHQLSLDHVVPRSRGGTSTWENVVCACLQCNIRKGGRTPKEARMTLVRRPFRPVRNPLLLMKLSNPRYAIWQAWLEGVHWEIDARD